MQASSIFRNFTDLTEKGYSNVVEQWLELESSEERKSFYEAEVFPRSCYRIRLSAPEDECELFLVPVGTQPYAPTIACLGTPARKTVLFYTKDSKTCADQVVRAFEDTRDFHLVPVSEVDAQDLTRKVHSAVDVLGQPRDVVCDITGGTKVMTATLAGVAALNGWRQVYVKSIFVQQKGSHHEEVLEVASFFDELGGWHRTLSEHLALAGNFRPAAEHLKTAAENALSTVRDAAMLKRYKVAEHYRQGRAEKVIRSAKQVANSVGTPLPSATLTQLEEKEPLEGLYFWMSRCLLSEGNELGAWALIRAHLEPSADRDGLKQTLNSLKREYRQKWKLDAWKPLDDLVGLDFTKGLKDRD